MRPSDTPREYVAGLAAAAEQGAGRARWGRRGAQRASAVVQREAAAVADAYERALFGAGEPAALPLASVSGWRGLWAALRRLWLVQRTSGATRK